MGSGSAFIVLGMHRSGTSAVTGALSLCGAWAGDESELTGANAENPRGFWERRDVRRICDRLLHTAQADWWKVAAFDPASIPDATLVEQRQEFAGVVSTLDEHGAWVVKEPRLCLLLPVLRDCIANPFCIHVFRNPLEVARSLQARNGFGIAGGIALWEAYNRHALSASRDLPRVFVSHESLMLHPVETLDALLERLDGLGATCLKRPDEDDIKRFVSPSLYRSRATELETQEYLAPSQRALWRQLCNNEVDHPGWNAQDSPVTRQYLLDLESTEGSVARHKDTANHLSSELKRRDRTIGERDEAVRERDMTIRDRDVTIRRMEDQTNALKAELTRRDAVIEDRDATIRRMEDRTNALKAELTRRDAAIEDRDATIRRMEDRTNALKAELTRRDAAIEDRDATIRRMEDRTNALKAELTRRDAAIEDRDATIRRMEDRTNALKAELTRRDAAIEDRDATIRRMEDRTNALKAELTRRDAAIEDRDATIRRMEDRTNALKAELTRRDAAIEDRDWTIRRLERRTGELNSRIHGLLNSNSWRVTAPLRSLSRGIRWFRKTLGRALALLFWICTGCFSRARDAMRTIARRTTRLASPGRDTRPDARSDRVSRLIAECRENNERVTSEIRTRGTPRDAPRTKVTVVAWDLAHNPLGRAYLLADALRREFDVELIGATFPPLRERALGTSSYRKPSHHEAFPREQLPGALQVHGGRCGTARRRRNRRIETEAAQPGTGNSRQAAQKPTDCP